MGRLHVAVLQGLVLFLSFCLPTPTAASLIMASAEKPDTQRILIRHEQYRTLTEASNMLKMAWSTKLERIAEDVVASCPPDVAQIRILPRLRGLGVNLGAAAFPPQMIDGYPEDIQTAIIDQWGGERSNFYTDSGCPAEPCDSWWQIVWSTVSQIGCSIKVCGDQSVMVCIYDRASNTKADLPFKLGKPCTSCPAGYSDCMANLCSLPDEAHRRLEEAELEVGSEAGSVTPIAGDSGLVQLPTAKDGGGVTEGGVCFSALALVLLLHTGLL